MPDITSLFKIVWVSVSRAGGPRPRKEKLDEICLSVLRNHRRNPDDESDRLYFQSGI